MLARIRKAQENQEGGFTLIELLVVMIIIGILAAIAIPAFLSQREKGYEAAQKSDLRSVATEISTALVDSPDSIAVAGGATAGTAITVTPTTATVAGTAATVVTSPTTKLDAAFVNALTGTYCVKTSSPKGGKSWVVTKATASAAQVLSTTATCTAAP